MGVVTSPGIIPFSVSVPVSLSSVLKLAVFPISFSPVFGKSSVYGLMYEPYSWLISPGQNNLSL